VRFEVIHPSPGDYWRSNDSSCVLVIEAGSTRFLLAGDIETPAERYLERTMPERLHAQVLVVPHHGSNTSSSQNFLAAV
jgi:competence protein ComEC